MTYRLIFVLLFVATSCSLVREKGEGRRFVLVWEEHFDTPQLDTTSWSRIPRGRSDWDRHMSLSDTCYGWSEGKYILYGRANKSPECDSLPYITGGIETKDKRYITYGRLEVCARFTHARGAWPAIWMLPDTTQIPRIAWPLGGEIDMMEHLNHDSIVHQTVHSEYIRNRHGIFAKAHPMTPPHTAQATIDPQGFNVYAVDITPDALQFYVNGRPTLRYPNLSGRYSALQYPFVTPFYLKVDMQLGGDWVGEIDPRELPVEMQVDWVRMYRYADK